MTLRSRIERLEASAQDVTRVQVWFWGFVPNRIEVAGTVFDRLPAESDTELIDRVSHEWPEIEITVFRWMDAQTAGD